MENERKDMTKLAAGGGAHAPAAIYRAPRARVYHSCAGSKATAAAMSVLPNRSTTLKEVYQ